MRTRLGSLCALAVVAAWSVTPLWGLAPASSPERTFEASSREFVSSARPPLRLRLPDGFRYLGRLQFALKEKAGVDRHLFGQVDAKRITRLVILQFEGLLDGIDGKYRFGIPSPHNAAGSNFRYSPERIRLGGNDYVHNTWAFDQRANASEHPGMEADRTLRHLDGEGWLLDGPAIMSRYVRAVGEEARDELILFYIVPLAETSHTLDDFPDGEPSSDVFDELSAKISAESHDLFSRLED